MGLCISPFTKRGESIPLPCGKCHECLARRASGWAYRLLKEAEISNSAHFITLTYDSKFIPISANGYLSLRRSDVQLFLKRLRKSLTSQNYHEKIRYYAIGEYGDHTDRPHYHLIMYNLPRTLREPYDSLTRAWPLGTIHVGNITPASVAYTLKYISKGKKVPSFEFDDRETEKALMSKGMGLAYITPATKRFHKIQREDLTSRLYVPIMDGKKIAMPRYYRNKIYTKAELAKIAVQMSQKCQRLEKVEDYLAREKIKDDIRINKYHKHERAKHKKHGKF